MPKKTLVSSPTIEKYLCASCKPFTDSVCPNVFLGKIFCTRFSFDPTTRVVHPKAEGFWMRMMHLEESKWFVDAPNQFLDEKTAVPSSVDFNRYDQSAVSRVQLQLPVQFRLGLKILWVISVKPIN